jgi:predicted RND superfamily exporter protein
VGRRERIEARLEDWGRSVHRHPWRAIGVMLAVTLGLASGAADLRFEASTENYLDPADPERSSYQAFRRQFVNDDTILLILHSERIFSFEFLARLRALHEDLEREVPLVDEVTSLINARVTRGSEDELIVEDLLETWPRSQAELEAVARRARSNPVYTNLLLSEDARFTTVTVNVTPTGGTTPDEGLGGFGEDGAEEGMAPASVEEVPILEGAELIRVVERLSEVTERHASADFPIYVTGNPEMTYSLVASSRRDMAVFTWVSLLVIGALLLLVFRRLSGVCIPLLVVILPLTATLGLMGWVGLPLTPSTQQLPTFLLVVGVADSVHLLTIFYRRLDAEDDREDAIGHALRHSGLAVVMTSLTTAGGLGSLAFADLTPIAGLGIAAPTGVLLALLYSLVLLPALVAVLPIRARRSSRREPGTLDRALGGVGDFCTRRPRTVVATWAVLVAAGGWGAFQLSLAYKPLSWFPETHPTRVAAEVANREMKGLMPLELLVDSGAANGLHEPELLRRIDEVQHFARSLAVNGIRPGQAISLVDVLKETHQALNANDPAYYAIPGDRRLVAQELLLFENSGSDDLEELVDRGFQTARVTLLVNYEDGLLYLPLVREVEDGARRILGDRVEITTTGLVKLWLRTITAMLWSTARSYSIALLVIAPLMVLLIGELRLGLLSLVPNGSASPSTCSR